MEECLTNGKKIPSTDFDELKTYLDNARSQLIKLQQKRLGQRDMIAFAYFRISDMKTTIEEIHTRQQSNLQDAISKLQINEE